jgi:AraC-like DNA-binding protein
LLIHKCFNITPMEDIFYEFVDLDSEESFQLLGNSLGGVLQNKTLSFNNGIAKGELVKSCPEAGLWIRKWKFTVFQKIIMHKTPPKIEGEKKFILIYFLNPSIFFLNSNKEKISVSGSRNNLFFTSETMIDFSVIPKQPFYVLDITFTASWISEQLKDANPSTKNTIDRYLLNSFDTTLIESCNADEYKTLHELEVSMGADNEDVLFIRSRVYNLILTFLNKIVNREKTELIQRNVYYEQMMCAERMIMQNLKEAVQIETIARELNMSISSLLRQFKLLYGKSIYEYYIEKKMEVGKQMILEKNMTVKEIAEMLGYNQPSSFIETFSKQYGYSPGFLKLLKE